MTGSEFLAYVKKVFERTDKDTEIYEATTDIVVDMRLRLMSDDYMTISSDLNSGMSVDDYVLDVPSDFGHLVTPGVLVRDTAADDVYTPLKKILKGVYDEIYQDVYHATGSNRNSGIPYHYAYYGRKLYIGPAVDKSTYEFKINYTTNGVTDITSSTDPVPFTDQYRRVVRDGVLMMMYKMLENFVEADRFEVDYERGLSKIERNDHDNIDSAFNIAYNGF